VAIRLGAATTPAAAEADFIMKERRLREFLRRVCPIFSLMFKVELAAGFLFFIDLKVKFSNPGTYILFVNYGVEIYLM